MLTAVLLLQVSDKTRMPQAHVYVCMHVLCVCVCVCVCVACMCVVQKYTQWVPRQYSQQDCNVFISEVASSLQ